MKKLLPFVITLLSFFCSSSYAQITITSANMPGSGDTIRYSACRPNSINTSTAGTNVFWNYDTLQSLNQGVYQYKAAFQTPYAFYFVGPNQYGLKIADSVGFSTYKFYDIYNFFKKTSSAYTVEGTGFKYNNIPLASQYSDEDELYSFPLSYLDHDSTTYKVTVQLGTGLYYTQVGYRINDVDAWGTIKTPYDSVACIRLVSTSYGKDSINFNGFPFTYPNVQRSYKWMSVTEKIPMLEVQGAYNSGNGTFTPVLARYRDNMLPVGMSELKLNTGIIKVFPNPATDEAYVFVKDVEASSIKFYSVAGQEVLSGNVSGNMTAVSLSTLANGIYFYSVANEKGAVIASGKITVSK